MASYNLYGYIMHNYLYKSSDHTYSYIVWSSKAVTALLHDSKVILEGCSLYLNFTWGSDLVLRGQTAFPHFFMVVETTNKNGIKKQCGHMTLAIDHQIAITDTLLYLIQYQTHRLN